MKWLLVLSLLFLVLPAPYLAGQEINLVSSTLWTGLNGLKVSGNYAFGSFPNGLGVFDISQPESIRFVSNLDCPGSGRAIALSGNYAFLAAYHRGLNIIDISNPTAPSFVSNLPVPGDARELCIQGDYAYLAAYDSGVQIINIANPQAPAYVGGFDTPGIAVSLAVDGNHLYLADEDSGLQVIDISIPSNPHQAGNLSRSYIEKVAISGNYAYLIQITPLQYYWNLLIVDISNPTSPESIGVYNSWNYSIGDLAIIDTLAFLSGADSSAVLNIAIPGAPTLVTRFGITGNRIVTQDTLAFIAQFEGGNGWDDDYFSLKAINITQPSNPVLISRYQLPSYSTDVAADSNMAYVANSLDGMKILNISDISHPVIEGVYSQPYPYSISVRSYFAYITAYRPSLDIVNVSDPANPFRVGEYSAYSDVCRRSYISGVYAYLITDSTFLTIVAIDNPELPYEMARMIHYGDYGMAVAVSGDYAYRLGLLHGIKVVDITNRYDPVIVDSLETPGYALDISLSGQFAYIADGDSGLFIADISDPANPSHVGTLALPGSPAVRVFVEGNYAYVASRLPDWRPNRGIYGVLHVVDIRDPANPVLVASSETSGSPQGLYVTNSMIFLADYYSFSIHQFSPTGIDEISRPIEFELLSNYPNPFNSQTSISFALPQKGPISLVIYDILGRRTAYLIDRIQDAGPHIVTWDARNTPSGLYFARLDAGKTDKTIKMMLLK